MASAYDQDFDTRIAIGMNIGSDLGFLWSRYPRLTVSVASAQAALSAFRRAAAQSNAAYRSYAVEEGMRNAVRALTGLTMAMTPKNAIEDVRRIMANARAYAQVTANINRNINNPAYIAGSVRPLP